MQYLMIDGHGDPNTSPEYVEAVRALYPVAYKLKFASARDLGRDYVVMPLEGLWWADSMDAFTASRDKSRWDWTMMIMTPDWIHHEMFDAAVERVGAKDPPARLRDVRLDRLSEGLCVQTLHVGSFDDEADVLAQMHDRFIPDNGLRMVGKHHEIYLSDPRKTAPEKLRTILRQPVRNIADLPFGEPASGATSD
ncbi:MAG: GyrI-like domain-containing protein [Micropruina sp.]|nr:GyrI-like domain-containing protein [Micropruina sp.]